MKKTRTDIERLNWLEENNMSLVRLHESTMRFMNGEDESVEDKFTGWAVCRAGFFNDLNAKSADTPREAIDLYMDEA